MVGGYPGRWAALRRFRRALANAGLRRVLVALAAVVVGGSAYQVALAVVAFSEGGAGGAGAAFAVQVLPVALLAPFTSIAADRFDRRRVMVIIDGLRFTCTGAVAVAVASGAPLAVLLLLGAPGAIASGAYAPASRAILPGLVGDPEELTAANAAMSGVEHAALLVGPALVGLLLVVGEPEAVFAVGSVMFLASAVLVAGIGGEHRPERGEHSAGDWRAEATAGLRTVFAEPTLRVLIGLYAAVTFVGGALQVFAVVVANELTGLGDSGVGWLFSALGAGGIVGTLVAVALAEHHRLPRLVVLGVALVGAPLVGIGVVAGSLTALLGVALVGIATVVVDVSLITLLQRSTADEVLGRVFGVLETVLAGMYGVGALAVPVLIAAFGEQGALIAAGAALPLLGLLAWRRLRDIEAPSGETSARVTLLRGLEIFAPLPAPTLESLAAHLAEIYAADGQVVIRQGERGDRFYLVREGVLDVLFEGRPITMHGPGEGFGEIALLRGVPRTATVIARGPARLYALDRDLFLSTLTAHPPSAAAGEAVAAARLAHSPVWSPAAT